MTKRILVVDDDENILSLERTILEQKGFDVTAAAGGAEALKLLAGQAFDLVLLDVCCRFGTGSPSAAKSRKTSA